MPSLVSFLGINKARIVGQNDSISTWSFIVDSGHAKAKIIFSREEGVVFLSIDDQHGLGLETADYLEYGVYQRKNLGYLYAIHHGKFNPINSKGINIKITL